ncbi:uncharacterized protein A4U43_C09F890 [Asparagus officinalis]|uniref:CASP-like protein n=1 Tax=Asparagus officinalis TaxID=4686 RepID=A0A5P1E7M6_ASPOF|nr:casparian strip membrane protein 2-like [Asparagus officinalis]ONK57475.1 uncharacterized protein A4U43_C09F890 [Asparagus officinalis]
MNFAGPSSTENVFNDEEKAPMAAPPHSVPPPSTSRAPRFAFFRKAQRERGWRRGIALFGFILRLLAIGATLSATIAMATTDETLPFFTDHYQFYANFSDLPALTFFVIGNAIAAGYLVLSLPLSIAVIICACSSGAHLFLLILDLVMVALTTAAASAATAIVYLAHTGNDKAHWVAFCIRFDGFCEQSSGALVASFVGIVILMMMVVTSALALRKH